jgi:hypothetical protein
MEWFFSGFAPKCIEALRAVLTTNERKLNMTTEYISPDVVTCRLQYPPARVCSGNIHECIPSEWLVHAVSGLCEPCVDQDRAKSLIC